MLFEYFLFEQPPPKKKKKEVKSPRTKREEVVVVDIEEETHTIVLNAKECSYHNVTVYTDRAEITREVEVDVQKGNTQITLSGVSHCIDTNTIRVEGVKGNVTILEVSSNVTFITKVQDIKPDTLKEEIEKLEKKIASLNAELERIGKESLWLNGWFKNHMEPLKINKKQTTIVDPFSPVTVERTAKFLDYQQKKMKDIDERRNKATYAIENLRKESQKYLDEINQLPDKQPNRVQEILIVVNCKAPMKVEFKVAYIVYSASWRSSYDVRVTSRESTLNMNYYGNIINNCGEDWKDASLKLSTAQPSVAGKPPELCTKVVSIKQTAVAPRSSIAPSSARSVTNMKLHDYQSDSRKKSSAPPVMTATPSSNMTSTTFSIPRKAVILADNKPHKVTIQQIKLEAEYTYTILPKHTPHAYLKASIRNTTKDVLFLPGPMNVFMDNNFIAKSEIPSLSPNESLGIFLGVDQGIKIEYQPLKQRRETQGILMNKTNLLEVKFNTVITNNKDKDVTITMFDNLPKSNDSQIKVKLLNPEIQEGNELISITPANNVQWKFVLTAGEKTNVPFHYTVEYPVEKDIDNAF